MLAIGAATIAFAVGCGDSTNDKASQLPADVEIEATAEAAPNSRTLDAAVPTDGASRSDAAQRARSEFEAASSARSAEEAHTSRSDAAQP